MTKTKKKPQKKNTIDDLQFKPIIIAFIAGLFLGTYAANANALMLFAGGVLLTVASALFPQASVAW